MHRLSLTDTPHCPWCPTQPDTPEHLLLHCPCHHSHCTALLHLLASLYIYRPSLADLLDDSQDSSLAFKMLKHTRLVRAPNPNKNKTKSTSCLIFISILDQGHAVRLGSSMSGQQQQQSASGVGRCRHDGKNYLETGSSVHRGESKFECQQCDKTFVSRNGLKYHTLTHSGVRNYECDECGKKFIMVLEIMSVKSVAKGFLPLLISLDMPSDTLA
ncbi:zinc finger protein 441-like [Scylla paramamosain]|uniref:zinc finger protein 441-like n=1 Tax=Scylla paramamosain TaxID=85552 RepID=UPI003082DE12